MVFRSLCKISRRGRCSSSINARGNLLFEARGRLLGYEQMLFLIHRGYFATVLHLNDRIIFEIGCRATNVLIK